MARRLPFLSLLFGFTLLAAAQDGITPSHSEKVATLEDTRIKESSGITPSMRHPECFWTLNDSGGEPCIFAIDVHGHTRAKVRLPNAVNFDWEDISSGHDEQGRPVLYIGDIGDNLKIRRAIQIYRIPEPDLVPEGSKTPEIISSPPTVWHVRFPGGPRNAESLLVHPQTRRIYILTKEDDGKSQLFAFPEVIPDGRPITLEEITTVTFPGQDRIGKRAIDDRMTTAADFSPDARHLVVATYSSLYEWDLPKGATLIDALAKPPRRMVPDLLRQLEGACYDADNRSIWITSEHLPTPLVKVTRP